ncbi:unnamed protein product [Notodromas monacha]|uniref:Uncharacterized protein n=1 Tax=Notodromas monacha TaxID=399045 RepID=A0A7R9BY02_9CRUS|nr:unnamed protein product [Notodromas monacha]CAG0923822.1 unnamed protein product [Notodromas monacha]
MAFLRLLVLLIIGVVVAGADCGPEDRVFACRDVCGEEVRGAGGYGRCVTFVGTTLFLDCVRQADLKEVKLLSPTVCVGRCANMDRVVTPRRSCPRTRDLDGGSSAGDEPHPVAQTANLAVIHVPASKTRFVVRAPPSMQQSVVVAQEVPHVIRAPSWTPEVMVNIKHVAQMANLAVIHVPASKTRFVVWAPPSTQQSIVVAQEVPHVIRAPSWTPEVTVNIKHGVAHVEADVDPWTAMVLVFMGLGGAGAMSLAVFLVWLVKFIRNKSSYMRELVRMLTPEDQQDPEAQPVVDLLGLEEADKPVTEEKEEELVLEDNYLFKEMLNA